MINLDLRSYNLGFDDGVQCMKNNGYVQVKRAHLLNANPYGKCSICGWLIDIREQFNYCPKCGSLMVDEDE